MSGRNVIQDASQLQDALFEMKKNFSPDLPNHMWEENTPPYTCDVTVVPTHLYSRGSAPVSENREMYARRKA